jgi:formylglycine-generating enzyme required for sulfatase activity
MTRAVRLLLPTVLSALCAILAWQPDPGQSAPAPLTSTKRFTNSIKMKLARIPSGKFQMGSPKDEPGRQTTEQQHEVQITRPFYMSVYHVTQAQYQKVVGKNPSAFSAGGSSSASVRGMNTSDFPVECVDWNDATAFCKKLSALPAEKGARRFYRLPTEAEWEYACRAGTTTPYYCGKTLTGHANFSGSSVNRVSKVGSYKPNAWGLYDMHANVWHMCADYYDGNYYRVSPRKDPPGPKNSSLGWVARGGSWGNPPEWCRSATRAWVSRGQRNNIVGFRVACDIGGRAR